MVAKIGKGHLCMMEEKISFNDYMILDLEISKQIYLYWVVDNIGEFYGLQLVKQINDPYKQRYVYHCPCYNIMALYHVLRFWYRKMKIKLR